MAIDSSVAVCVTYRIITCSCSLLMDSSSEDSAMRGSQYGKINHPLCICVDSPNTVYVTDEENHHVSSGQFMCFSTQGSGEGELNHPKEVAVDNTIEALYVCFVCDIH